LVDENEEGGYSEDVLRDDLRGEGEKEDDGFPLS